jgi:hypothetical protein
MRKDIEESTETVSDSVHCTEVDVEDKRGATARRIATTDPPTGDRRRVERWVWHCPSRRPRYDLTGERAA